MSITDSSCIGFFSKGIGKLPYLSSYLGAPCQRVKWSNRKSFTHICGWGMKPTSRKARAFAARKGLPYISLEDGFVRSLGLGVHGALPLSLVVDYSGIYYDARSPSDLEDLILQADFPAAELQEAQRCMDLLCQRRLSKYNHAPDWMDDSTIHCEPPPPYRVLVVDQTAGDASIELGMADAQRFTQMLEAALDEHPDAQILVKVHPDVLAGKKTGHLLDLAQKRGCVLLACDVSPWALLDRVDEVYVVTSQLGFEALLAGKKVHCFGMPFYAGWGLTLDRLVCERRNVKRSLEEVFTAAYLRYCRYVNPYTGEPSSLQSTLDLLADQKRMARTTSGLWIGVDFSRWKQSFLPRFFGPQGRLGFISSQRLRQSRLDEPARLITWAGKTTPEFERACQQDEVELWRMEDGFIRSVGLGVDLVAPLSLVLDSKGIYFDATRPSDLEDLLGSVSFDDHLLSRASILRERLVKYKLSKYNVGKKPCVPLSLPEDQRILLVPGQVESDASIRLGSPRYKTNLQLLQAVRDHNPDAFVVYKPHPDVLSGGRLGAIGSEESCSGLVDLLVENLPMPELLEQVDEVHTLSSLTGFEALLRGHVVVTYGMPFYAGWGLTRDLLNCPRRKRVLELDELVAATLILYPLYCDPKTGDLVNAETAMDLLRLRRSLTFVERLTSLIHKRLRKAY